MDRMASFKITNEILGKLAVLQMLQMADEISRDIAPPHELIYETKCQALPPTRLV